MIDFHTHPVMIRELLAGEPQLERAVREVFQLHFPAQPLSLFLAEMDEAGVQQAVLLPLDCTTAHGCRIVTNEQVAELCGAQPPSPGLRLGGPLRQGSAPKQLERAVRGLGLQGPEAEPGAAALPPR